VFNGERLPSLQTNGGNPMSQPINEPLSHICKLCKKQKAKNVIFCEDCLSKENRDQTFIPRLKILKDIQPEPQKRGVQK